MRDHNGGKSECTSPLPRHNATRRVGIRDIAEQQITRRRHGQDHCCQKEGDVQSQVRPHQAHHGKRRLERRGHLGTLDVIGSRNASHRRHRLGELGRRQEGVKRSLVVHCLSRRHDFTRCIFHAILVTFTIHLDRLGFNIRQWNT